MLLFDPIPLASILVAALNSNTEQKQKHGVNIDTTHSISKLLCMEETFSFTSKCSGRSFVKFSLSACFCRSKEENQTLLRLVTIEVAI